MNISEAATELREKIDIAEIVSARVSLKKTGKDLLGLCPFHDDKSPSFTVSPAKGFYYCFSCAAGGDAIKFLMELDKRSFSDVVKDLAAQHGIEVTQERSPEQEQRKARRDRLKEVMAAATDYFCGRLSGPALDYLTNQRGLSPETIARFRLGHADGRLHQALADRYAAEDLVAAGLILRRKSGEGYYDRFRDRLIIPICDGQGQVIGFGGRSLNGDEPKYLNSPETELFDKGRTLFGLDLAKGAIAKADTAIVVEGYFDVIALHAAGVENVVAALGTALSQFQVRALSRLAKRIVLNFDSDSAGQKAADRAIGEAEELALAGDLDLRVLPLPSGKDADEFLKGAGADQYRQMVLHAPRWVDWRIDRAIAKPEQSFEATVRQALGEIAKLPRSSDRLHQVHELSVKLARGDRVYARRLEKTLLAQLKPKKQDMTMPDRERVERSLAALWIQGRDRELIDRYFEVHQIDWGLDPVRRALADFRGDRPNPLLDILIHEAVTEPAAHLLNQLDLLDRGQGDRARYELFVDFWIQYELLSRRLLQALDSPEFGDLELRCDRLYAIVEAIGI